MKKKFLENFLTVFFAMFFVAIIAFFTKKDFQMIVSELTQTLILAELIYVFSGLARRIVYKQRKLITAMYLIGLGFALTAIGAFEVAYLTSNFTLAIIFLSVSFVFFVLTIGWGFYCTKREGYECEEIELITWLAFVHKVPKLDKEALKIELNKILRFRLQNDRIEGLPDFTSPIDVKTHGTLIELSKDGNNAEVCQEIENYINLIVDKYFQEKESKQTEAKKEEQGR